MPDIDRIANRPAAYLAETGVPQLAGGLVFVFLGCSVLVRRLLPQDNSVLDYQLALQIAGVCCAGAVLWFGRFLKHRVVFPRGGYVQPQTRKSRYFLILIVPLLGLLVTLSGLGPVFHLDSRLVAPGFAIAFSVVFAVSGWQQKKPSMIWAGGYFAALAPFLWWLPTGNYERISFLQVAGGIALAAAGVIRIKGFLKANPRPVEMSNG